MLFATCLLALVFTRPSQAVSVRTPNSAAQGNVEAVPLPRAEFEVAIGGKVPRSARKTKALNQLMNRRGDYVPISGALQDEEYLITMQVGEQKFLAIIGTQVSS